MCALLWHIPEACNKDTEIVNVAPFNLLQAQLLPLGNVLVHCSGHEQL